MSDKITVRAGERGLIWVFAVDLDQHEVAAFDRRNGEWGVEAALGTAIADPEHVEVFDTSDLAGLGLSGYLEEGLGVPSTQLDGLRPQLDGVKGSVLVLTSKAFGGQAVVFQPRTPLRLLASLSEQVAQVSFEPLVSEAAAGVVAGKAVANPPTAKRNWIVPLLILCVVVTGFALWWLA